MERRFIMTRLRRTTTGAEGSSTGFTLVELLVVIAIIGILVALLLPAIQAAREAARRSQCQNNMKQLGLATLNYESSKKELPPGHWDESATVPRPGGGFPTVIRRQHSSITYILPFMEETTLGDQWDFDQKWFHADAKAPIDNWRLSLTPLPMVVCPTAPAVRERNLRLGSLPAPQNTNTLWLGATDYTVCEQINRGGNALIQLSQQKLIRARPNSAGGYFSMLCPHTKQSLDGNATALSRPKLSDTTDGTSQTFMWFETGGRPLYYREGKPGTGTQDTQGGHSWAEFENWHDVHERCGTGLMNCTNDEEIYSFHVGGCYFTMGDGAVRFVEDNVDPDVFVSLFTRDGQDIIDAAALK
jgi:prepilin-type N-terminal cleavage/methylation domain-containing protein